MKHFQNNPRKITPADIERLKASMLKYGDLSGITHILDTDEVISGNQRSDIGELLDKEPVITERFEPPMQDGTTAVGYFLIDGRRFNYRAVRGWTREEQQEANLLANAAGGQWDWNLLGTFPNEVLSSAGFTSDKLKEIKMDVSGLDNLLSSQKPESSDAEPQTDKANELLEKWGVKTGDLWQIGEHRLLCGDSTKWEDVERVMGGERADCVFTSFPYAVGVDYGETYEDNIENLRRLLNLLSVSFLDVVFDGGFAVLNFGDIAPARNIAGTDEPSEYPMALEYYPVFRSAGWLLWSRRIWCKPNARVNSLWCISSNRAATDWEHIWTFRKPGEAIVKRVDGEYRSSLGWFETDQDKQGVEKKETHGAGMPILTAQKMVAIHSRPASIVHEPFIGTGTTLIACQNLGRRGRGIELSPAYCSVTLERMSQAFPGIEIKRL